MSIAATIRVRVFPAGLGALEAGEKRHEAAKRFVPGRVRADTCASVARYVAFIVLFFGNTGLLPVCAQVDYATAILRGTTYDPQGAVVPAATVIVTNPTRRISQSQNTASDGTYQVQALAPGTYEVAVEAKGFSRALARNVVLTVGQIVTYDIHLTLGPFSETVEVTDRPPLIEAQQTQQANTVNSLQVVNLPNISRDFAQAIYTVPGVVSSQAPSVQDPNIGTGYLASGFSIGGSNGRNNLFTIDGGENDFGSGAPRVAQVPQDSVQEFQVNRSAFGAEFGFTVGAAINVVTKSGTNKYHGDAFGY